MPCFNPLSAYMYKRRDGTNHVVFKPTEFRYPADGYNLINLPCGRCIGCRLERSRQWATRISFESQLYDANAFITLTYNDEHLPLIDSGLPTLRPDDLQKFLKRLRFRFSPQKIRFFGAGEYGDTTLRPHYHVCLLGFQFPDLLPFSSDGVNPLYISQSLVDVWSHGHCIVGNLTFESAAYVARYCCKKITGKDASSHYQGRVPEFCRMSRRPGIGLAWYEQYQSDVYPLDEVIVNGRKCKPPRYFDEKFRLTYPEIYSNIKAIREEKAKDADTSMKRLLARQRCKELKFESQLQGVLHK